MDITNIANLATTLSSVRISEKVGVAVLKKALDIAEANALMLIQALPPFPAPIFLPISVRTSIQPPRPVAS